MLVCLKLDSPRSNGLPIFPNELGRLPVLYIRNERQIKIMPAL